MIKALRPFKHFHPNLPDLCIYLLKNCCLGPSCTGVFKEYPYLTKTFFVGSRSHAIPLFISDNVLPLNIMIFYFETVFLLWTTYLPILRLRISVISSLFHPTFVVVLDQDIVTFGRLSARNTTCLNFIVSEQKLRHASPHARTCRNCNQAMTTFFHITLDFLKFITYMSSNQDWGVFDLVIRFSFSKPSYRIAWSLT